jgi:hypothetical protein
VPDRFRFRWLTLAAALAMVASGCGGSGQGTSTKRSSKASSHKASAPHVPNPFSVVARYSASALGLRNPRDLAIGPNGDLYITDATNRVTVVSPAGKVLRRWGKPGSRAGEFSFVAPDRLDPFDIAASIWVGPTGDVYVSDSGNTRIEVFSPGGRFIRKFGRFGVGAGQFELPYDVVVGANGDVYVADLQLSTVTKLLPTGKQLWQIGGPTASNSPLQGEIHLGGIDTHGRLVASSDSQHAIIYVDGAGHEVDTFNTTGDFPVHPLGPCDVTIDRAGYTFVTSCGASGACGGSEPAPCNLHFELVFDRTHRLVGAWYHTPFLADPGLSPRFGPHGEAFALGADGSVVKLRVRLPGA